MEDSSTNKKLKKEIWFQGYSEAFLFVQEMLVQERTACHEELMEVASEMIKENAEPECVEHHDKLNAEYMFALKIQGVLTKVLTEVRVSLHR